MELFSKNPINRERERIYKQTAKELGVSLKTGRGIAIVKCYLSMSLICKN